jgi:ATP-dependent DNA helicase RecQ
MKTKPASKPAIRAERTEETVAQPTETFRRERTTTAADPTEGLTPEQQTLYQRLRDWRKTESEKLGMPLFFVLSSSALRSIVLLRPKTIAQLKTITGLGQEKIDKFGPGIIHACTT